MNLEIREFSETIKKYVNENSIPIEVKRMVLKELLQEVDQKTNEELLKEIEERDGKKEKSHAKSL